MPFETIPNVPVALTAEQAEIMSQKQVKKHNVAIVLLHWFNATVWLLELATGAALIVAPDYRFMPIWYLRFMEEAFGTRANLLRGHIAIGLTWIVVFLVYAVFGWRDFLHTEVLRKEVGLDKDDFNWLRIRTLRLIDRSSVPLPPQGAYNAGQKLYALMIYTMIPIIMITGVIMTFHFGTALVQWAMLIHFVAAGMVVSGLMVHVYMGAVFPEERPAFYSMITGLVDELYAYKHHFKWWREVKTLQRQWESEQDALAHTQVGVDSGQDSKEADAGASAAQGALHRAD
jgi:formate dehydrogenase subunit gamma